MKLDPQDIHCTWMATALQRLLMQRRGDIIEMLNSCGVDPYTIPLWPEIWREGQRVHLDRYMLTEGGGIRRGSFGPMVEEFVIEPDLIPSWIPFD